MDDIMIGRSKTVIQDFKSQLSKKSNIKDIGEASDYLGTEILRNRTAGTLTIHRIRHCRSLLKKYGTHEWNSSPMPIPNKHRAHSEQSGRKSLGRKA